MKAFEEYSALISGMHKCILQTLIYYNSRSKEYLKSCACLISSFAISDELWFLGVKYWSVWLGDFRILWVIPLRYFQTVVEKKFRLCPHFFQATTYMNNSWCGLSSDTFRLLEGTEATTDRDFYKSTFKIILGYNSIYTQSKVWCHLQFLQ